MKPEQLREKFKVECIENVILYTIRHSSNEDSFEFLDDQKEILLEQFALNTLQKIVRE